MTKSIRQWEDLEEATKRAAKDNPLKKQADDLVKFNSQLQQGSQLFDKLQAGPKALKTEVNRLVAEYTRLVTAQQNATKTGDFKKIQSEIDGVKARLKQVNDQLDETPKKTTPVAGGFDKIGKAIKTAFTVTGILFVIGKVVEFGQKLIEVTGIGQKYQNQFTRIFEGNSAAAKGYLASLQNVADTTNFTFDTLADNAAKLASRGITPTKKELLGLGDVANFIGKDFGQLNEAILDINNTERWRELGLTVTTQGNKMTLSYGDFSTTVDKTVKGAYNAIQAFSQLTKVQGSTIEAGESLAGKVSTLGDVFAGLFRTIGQGNSGVLGDVVDLLTYLVQKGIELYKTLVPAFNAIGGAFAGVGRAIGGIFSVFANFQSEAEKSATASQKFGFYVNKYLVNPLVGVTLVVAGVIEAFNLIVLGSQLAGAKLRGDDSLATALSKQVDEVKGRLNELREEGQKLRDGFGIDLDTYVRRDNQRTRREERRDRLNTEEAENFKPTETPPKPKVTDPKEQKKLDDARKKANEQLVDEKKKLEEEFKRLEEDYAKAKLENLDKNSQEYIEQQRLSDLKQIEDRRKFLTEIGQLSTGKLVFNVKKGTFDIDKNEAYQLPDNIKKVLDSQTNEVNAKAALDSGRLAEEEFDRERQREQQKRAEGELQFDKEQAKKRETLARQTAELQLELDEELYKADSELTRKAGENEIDFERAKNEKLLSIRLDYYKKLLALAEADPTKKDQVTGLRNTILNVERELKTIRNQAGQGPQDLFELLGITFDADADKNDIIKKQVLEATETVIDGANKILEQQIATDQARIDSIDRQLEAKQREIDTEATLAAAGLANNLTAKRQEQAALEAARKKEIDSQRQAQKIQLGINASLQASELALAIAKIFNKNAKLPIVGVIAAGIEIAAMFVALGSTLSQIGKLPKYHDGDEVTYQTARHRMVGTSNRRSDEVDARLQIGEGVIRKKSYQANKGLLQHINALGRPVDFGDLQAYIRANPIEMVEGSRERGLQQINQYYELKELAQQPDIQLHQRIDGLNERVDTLIAETRKIPKEKVTALSDGRLRIEDERGNVEVVRLR